MKRSIANVDASNDAVTNPPKRLSKTKSTDADQNIVSTTGQYASLSHLESMPTEIINRILFWLPPMDALSLSQASTLMHDAALLSDHLRAVFVYWQRFLEFVRFNGKLSKMMSAATEPLLFTMVAVASENIKVFREHYDKLNIVQQNMVFSYAMEHVFVEGLRDILYVSSSDPCKRTCASVDNIDLWLLNIRDVYTKEELIRQDNFQILWLRYACKTVFSDNCDPIDYPPKWQQLKRFSLDVIPRYMTRGFWPMNEELSFILVERACSEHIVRIFWITAVYFNEDLLWYHSEPQWDNRELLLCSNVHSLCKYRHSDHQSLLEAIKARIKRFSILGVVYPTFCNGDGCVFKDSDLQSCIDDVSLFTNST